MTVEELSLEGRSEIRSPQRIKINLQELEGPQTLSVVDGKWELQGGYRIGQAPSLTFWWSGDVAGDTRDPSAVDPALADQLRALGYLE